jgi:hypothetical protein
MIAAKDDRIGTGPLDLLDNSGVINRTRSDALVENNFGFGALLDEFLGKLGKSFAVVTLVVDNGDFFGLQYIDCKIDLGTGLGIVRGNGTVEVILTSNLFKPKLTTL